MVPLSLVGRSGEWSQILREMVSFAGLLASALPAVSVDDVLVVDSAIDTRRAHSPTARLTPGGIARVELAAGWTDLRCHRNEGTRTAFALSTSSKRSPDELATRARSR
jgi:hypothetical protein